MGDEQWQANISDLRERVVRVEVKTEGVEAALRRFDAHLDVVTTKIDEISERLNARTLPSMAMATSGLLVGESQMI